MNLCEVRKALQRENRPTSPVQVLCSVDMRKTSAALPFWRDQRKTGAASFSASRREDSPRAAAQVLPTPSTKALRGRFVPIE